MTDLQIFVAVVFIAGNLWITAYNRTVRRPATKSRREQIARIRSEERATRIR